MTIVRVSDAGPTRDTSGDGLMSWSHVIDYGGADHGILLVAETAGTSSSTLPTAYTESCSSSLDGSLTNVMGANKGQRISNTNLGSVFLYAILNPSAGTHTISTSLSGWSGTLGQTMARSVFYTGVSIYDTAQAFQCANTNSVIAISANSSSGYQAFTGIVTDNAPSTFNQTTIYGDGAATTGRADYIIVGEATASGATVSFSDTSTGHLWGGIVVNLIPYSAPVANTSGFFQFMGGAV